VEVIIALVVLFVFVTIAFLAIAYFLPEWVGIQGKVAKEIESQHRGDTGEMNKSKDQ
jgi:hypothetical protein